MNTRIKIAKIAIPMIAVLFAIAFAASPVSAGVATVLNGNCFYEDGSPAVPDSMRIINTNTSVEWNQSTAPVDVVIAPGVNYYQLTLDDPSDVAVGNILRYIATNGTSWTNTSNATYTKLDFEYNITFKGPPRKPAISVSPSTVNVSHGDLFMINITVDPAGNEIYGAQYDLLFDTSILNATSQSQGTFLSQDGASTAVIRNKINNTIGKIEYGETRTGVENGVTTPDVLASITFKAIEPGTRTSNLNLSNVMLSDPNGTSIETGVNNGTVIVKGLTSFNISGFVYTDGEPVLNPDVNITNLNTSDVFIAETNESSNYYLISTDSGHVSAGNILHFHASNGNTTEFDHTVTEEEMNAGGFVQNILIAPPPKPDLIVAEMPVQLVFANVSNNITTIIENDGTADVGSFDVSLGVNETIIDKLNIAGLDAGNTTTINFVWTPSQTGNYSITVNADCDDDVTESNETNNELPRFVSVLPAKPELAIEDLKAYHYHTDDGVWFNLTNFVNISVVNDGYSCNGFNLTLKIDGTEFKKEIFGLEAGAQTNVIFNWTPIGVDCMKGGSPRDYTIKAFVDSDSDVEELNETNNNASSTTTVYWNGYRADEPLDNVAHGKIRGGLYYTTGDSNYIMGGVPPGKSVSALYNITLPPGAEVKLARLNLYYTWTSVYPEPEISITTPNGTTYHNISLDKSYNERKCFPGFNLLWGNYVFNLTTYVNGNGIYNVTVKEFSSGYPCYAGRGIVIVYEDDSMPLREYWIDEGADVLIGGRRRDGGGLSLEECINNATFPGSIDLSKVNNATLAVVSPWSNTPWSTIDGEKNMLYFNGIELGRDVYTGYQPIGDISLDGIRMTGSGHPQVGVNLSEVTGYLNASVNIAGQGDNGDCMMPSNAFLVVEYKEEIFDFDTGHGTYPSIPGVHKGNITPKHDIVVNKMYTYPCEGTGGHSESVRIYGYDIDINGTWNGYHGDYHNITFPHQFTLFANHTYNYTIRTGSYPQIHHTAELEVDGGTIRCTEFIDANGRRYNNWIPAIRWY